MASRKTLVKTKDILTDVSIIKGLPYETVELIYKTMINYAIMNSKKEDVICITFPFLGPMYVKKGFLLKKLSAIKKGKYSEKDNGKRTISKIENKIKLIDQISEKEGFIYNTKRSILNNYAVTQKSSLEERENKQNNYFNEK